MALLIHRDSHYVLLHRGGTQDTDFNKGITGFVYEISSAKKWGGVRGTQAP